MIFYYNASGDILSAVFDEVYQGSNKANTIYFVCPTLRSNTVNVAFTLPDGTDTARHTMTLEGISALNGVLDGDGNSFSVWKYKVPTAITAKRGLVRAQFYIVTPTETVATAAVDFTVRKGVSGTTPEIGDSYEELVTLMSEYSSRIDDAEDDIEDKLDKKTAATAYSAVYGFNQSGQTEFKVDTAGAATSGQIPLYNPNGSIVTGTPSAATDAANKGYVDTNYGKTLELSLNNSTYVLTLNLKNASGTVISTDSVDLPIESVVVGGSYNNDTKKVILTLQSGSTIEVSVGDLISGLQSEITSQNKLSADLIADSAATNKFVTATEKAQISTNASNITVMQSGKIGVSQIDAEYFKSLY